MSSVSAEAPLHGVPTLVCVDPARVHDVWPHVAALIAAAMRRSGLGELADVARSVGDGAALLWLAWDGERILAAAVTELHLIDGEKLCTILACGGTGFAR